MSSIVDIINHYQKSIDKSLHDEARLVHCIGKLYRLPVSVQHLKDTGIGRTVNGLRKYDGEVGVAAKALVSKWKNMVAAEESDTGEPDSHQEEHDEPQDEDNCDESRLQVDEDHHSDEGHHDANGDDEEDEDEEQHHREEESDNQEEIQEQQQEKEVKNGHDSDHRNERSSHRDSDRHSSSSSKHKSSSSSKDSSRSRDRHDKHRDGDKSKHHSSSSSSSKKNHSSPSSTSSSKKSSSHGDEEKDRKEKHSSSSSKKDSSHSNGKESSHSSSSSKEKSSDKHHSSKSKEGLNGYTKESDNQKRKRVSEDEEESAVKKSKKEHTSESKSKTSSSDKDRSSSKSSSSGSSRDKDKKSSSEKKKESSSKKKKEQQSPEAFEDEGGDEGSEFDNSGGASFADALAMIGMPSSSKKKSSSKGSTEKVKISTSSSMPPPPTKSDKNRSSSSSSKRSISPCSTASSSGYSSTSSTPSLLAQKPSPLPIAEIVESLPMISPNYKPMPLNQTVMECVFSNNGKPQKRALTEEEALGQSMQSKNIRTKVYSGVKNFKGEVPTLYNLCIRLLQEHIDLIDYTGGIPFDLLKPVLERASPEQLFTLESYNPYLMEDSDVLWEQHIKRNFRSQKRKEEECESWREMFIRCSEERESKLLSLTANIKQSQVEKTAPIRKTQLAYVDSAVKPPRNIISKQARYGTAQAPVVSPAARVAALKNNSSNVAKAGDSRLKVAAGARDNAQAQVFHPTKPRKAPLMSKVMQSIKGFKGFRR
uniref:Putative transcription elongation factor b polypeptide 3 n=1 Tax=Aedes aegypti TaxID=7159 RepID=A0A0P6IVB8_AEDAE